VFHYRGDRIEHKAETNLVRPPKTIGGPLALQIRNSRDVVLDALASGVQVGPFGFEIVQRYPLRVLTEAITNAVIHRDYRLSADIHVRLFDNRIEVESPGGFPGRVTTANIGFIGSQPRNRALVDHLREFPTPPNLDAGEGVRMMVATMGQANLYPPVFLSTPELDREAVLLLLFNEARPTVWNQVKTYLEKHGEIGNAEVRAILQTDDPVRASKLLRSWLERGLLALTDPKAAKQNRRYRLPGVLPPPGLFSKLAGKDKPLAEQPPSIQ
jgi:ATP-dependent DNA helicase RecG